MRVLILLDCVWIALLLAFGGVLYHAGEKRATMREDAERIRRELGLIESALRRAVAAESLPAREELPFAVYGKYLDGGSRRLRENGLDPLGNAYGPQPSNRPPSVPVPSAEFLEEVVDLEFWEPYTVGGR